MKKIGSSAWTRGFRFAMGRRSLTLCQICREIDDISPFKVVVRAPDGGCLCLRCAVRFRLVEALEPPPPAGAEGA